MKGSLFISFDIGENKKYDFADRQTDRQTGGLLKEDYIFLKNKYDGLSQDEKLLREEHLRRLSDGTEYGPLTGYSSIDRPSLKYCRSGQLRDLSKYSSIYELIFCDKDMDKNIIGYLDGKCNWTYKKLKDTTDRLIDSFRKDGISIGDNVLCGVTTTPEFVAAFIALVSIGAVVKLFDIRASETDMVHYANSSNCKYAIALNIIVAPKLQNIIEKTSIKKVYVMNPANSLSFAEKMSYLVAGEAKKNTQTGKAEKIKDKRFVSLTKTIKDGNSKYAERVLPDYSRAAVKVQSSGTTGKAKTIVHSEKTMVEFAKSVNRSDIAVGSNHVVLVALPPWIAYGIGNAIIDAIIFNSKIELCADFEPNAVYRNIGRFTTSFAAPFHYRYIREHYAELGEDMKRQLKDVASMVTGGDKYSALENEADEKLFGTKVLNGYGNNELWGGFTINPLHHNVYGSVGAPIYGEDVISFDSDNGVELPYYQIGEICARSSKVFMEYEDNEADTKKTLVLHEDGNVYLHTGDLGYIDKDGFVHLSGRKERVITRLGFKISAYTIEDAIGSIPLVKECIAVEVPDAEEEHVPMIFVVPSDVAKMNPDELKEEIISQAKNVLKTNEIPKHVSIEKALKYTDNNKYDFRFYEKAGREFVEQWNATKH